MRSCASVLLRVWRVGGYKLRNLNDLKVAVDRIEADLLILEKS
mgnify:CR=1